jgi:hypothetical protein
MPKAEMHVHDARSVGRSIIALGATLAANPALAESPSFDCSKARLPDEIVICQTPQLAELDNLEAAGYAFLRKTRGRAFADEIGIPIWRQRRACQADVNCVQQRQIEGIQTYQTLGAPVILPGWVSQQGISGPQSPASDVAPMVEESLSESTAYALYRVEGVRLGDSLPNSSVYQTLKCSPSEVFLSSAWCQRTKQDNGTDGSFSDTIAFLMNDQGKTYYLARVIEPAFFHGNDIDNEIDRLSRIYGQRPNVLRMPQRAGFPAGIIVSYGDVTLIPLDAGSIDLLAKGENPKIGFMVDFLGDFKRSAQEGLPMYLLSGRAGMIWNANYDEAGKGLLRISAIDASKLSLIHPRSVASNPAPVMAFAPTPAPAALARANLGLTCRPGPVLVGERASNPKYQIIEVTVRYDSNGWYVAHKLADGELIVRSDQYAVSDASTSTSTSWRGKQFRNPNITMVGEVRRAADGHPVYEELIYDATKGGAIVGDIVNDCAFNSPPPRAPEPAPTQAVNPAPAVASTPVPAPAAPPASVEDPARQERERADRLARDKSNANSKIDETSQFLKAFPQNTRLSDYVQAAVALKTALEQGDPDNIERKLDALTTRLNEDKDYLQFIKQQEAQKRIEDAKHLGEFVKLAQIQRDFITKYVTNNLTASAVTKLAPLMEELSAAIANPNLDRLQALTARVEAEIRSANLYNEFQQSRVAQATPQAAPSTSEPKLPETEKNSFLIKGEFQDVVILYNSTPDAPHIALNLRGDYVFANDSVRICLFGENPEDVAQTVQLALDLYHPKEIAGMDGQCDVQHLAAYDLVAVQRGVFLKSPQADALVLIGDVEAGAFRKFRVITAQEINTRAEAERAAVTAITQDVANSARAGYGVILLKSRSPNLCLVATQNKEAHRQLVLKNGDELTLDMRASPSLVPISAEEAFEGAQKAQCGAVYAEAGVLKTFSEALTKANIQFAFSSIWITPEDLNAEVAKIAEANRQEAQQATERAQREADEAALRAQRSKDVESALAAEQQTLRTKYDSSARAAVSVITTEVNSVITNVVSAKQGGVVVDKQESAVDFFPHFAAWLAGMKADHWAIMTTNFDIQDYGTSEFKGRTLETALARVSLRLKNPILGEYKDACFVIGQLFDPEFSTNREPLDVNCEDDQTIAAWQAGHNFQSRWTPSGGL